MLFRIKDKELWICCVCPILYIWKLRHRKGKCCGYDPTLRRGKTPGPKVVQSCNCLAQVTLTGWVTLSIVTSRFHPAPSLPGLRVYEIGTEGDSETRQISSVDVHEGQAEQVKERHAGGIRQHSPHLWGCVGFSFNQLQQTSSMGLQTQPGPILRFFRSWKHNF